jgi:hypothetical protein
MNSFESAARHPPSWTATALECECSAMKRHAAARAGERSARADMAVEGGAA